MYQTSWQYRSSRRTEPLAFKYGLLKSTKTGIRLAQILPGSGNKGIAIDLIDSFVSGSGQVNYDALSYTWGDGNRSKSILCNGKRLSITQTLFEALQRFRDPNNVVTLWIDQICICQERLTERNQQVALMGKIFKGARKVIVWLGEDYDDGKAGMQLAKQLLGIARYQPVSGLTPADLETHGLPRRGHKRWAALSAILRRPWFWRTWVVQEVVLNPNVELVLGASMITWDDLESIVTLLEGPIPRIWQLDQTIAASELPFSRINRIRLRHQRLISTPVSPSQSSKLLDEHVYTEPVAIFEDEEEDDPELLDLLMMSRGLGASDPRDKIYALLGLSKHDINPDYSLSPESVFTDFALQTVGVVTNMAARRTAANIYLSAHDRDVRRAMILISCAGRHQQQLKLPSWVPDWTVNLSSRPLIFGVGQRFAAGGSRLGVFDWQPDFGLQLCGKLLDTVAVAGAVYLEYDLEKGHTNSHEIIRQWAQEAHHLSNVRVARSPGSTTNVDAFKALCRDLFLCKHGYFTGGPHNSQRGERRGSNFFDELDDQEDSKFHNASRTLTIGPTRGRVLFVSSTGYVGLAPHGTREGDLVYVVIGADVPLVLRPFGDAYELIGEAYVQGVMDGEVVKMDHIPVEDLMVR